MKTIKDRISQILHEALRGYNQSARYRTGDGFVRWGLVEKDIIAAVDEATNPPMIDWQPIETAPKDGSTVLVWFERAGVQIVHLAWYQPAEEWERDKEVLRHYWESVEEWEGWWSYTRGSITREKLDDWQTPTRWALYNGPKEGDR